MFQVLHHHVRIRSLFISGSSTSCPDSIPYFCFGISRIALEFNPLVLFWVLRHCALIRSLLFLSGSLASCSDFSYLLWHRAQISLSFSGIVFGFFIFSSIMSGFPYLPRHRVRASFIFFGIVSGFLLSSPTLCLDSSSSSALCSDFAYLLQHRTRISLSFPASSLDSSSSSASCPNFIIFSCIVSGFLIFFGIMTGFHYFFQHCVWMTLSSSTLCQSIAYLFWYHIRLSLIFTSIVSESLIFPSIVLGFL